MKKCKTCPFILNTPNHGCMEWLWDVIKLFEIGSTSHSCHVTDAVADGYIGGEKRDCVGIKQLKTNNDSKHHVFKDVFPSGVAFVKHHMAAIRTKQTSQAAEK